MTSNDTGTGPEQDAIERVAEALWHGLAVFMGVDPLPWPPGSVNAGNQFRHQAGVAIAAMQPAPPVAVTEAMVERAVRAYDGTFHITPGSYHDARTAGIRACLEAALGAPPVAVSEAMVSSHAHASDLAMRGANGAYYPLTHDDDVERGPCEAMVDTWPRDVLNGAWTKITILPGTMVLIDYEVGDHPLDTAQVFATAETARDAVALCELIAKKATEE